MIRTREILSEYDLQLKILLISEQNELVNKAIDNYSSQKQRISQLPTLGVQYTNKIQEVQNKKFNTQLWSLANTSNNNIARSVYQSTNAMIILYDTNDTYSFQFAKSQLCKIVQGSIKQVVLLVGNVKQENQRKITYQQGESVAASLGVRFIEIDIGDKINMNGIIKILIEEWLEKNDCEIEDHQLLQQYQQFQKLGFGDLKVLSKCCQQ